MNYDCIVLGAGIIGVSTALHLQAHGKNVCLIDKLEPGEGTSFGNSGLIERSSIVPYAFPRNFSRLFRYALNNESDVHFFWNFVPNIAPWLARYWYQSASKRLAQATKDMWPLIEHSVTEHDLLIEKSNMQHLIKAQGWIEVFRDERVFEQAKREAQALASYQLNYDVLSANALQEREPAFYNTVKGGIHWLDPKTVSNPSALVKGYAALFLKQGGNLLKAEATTLIQLDNTWALQTEKGQIKATEVVVALGADSSKVLKPLGYSVPLAIKRGHHLHFEADKGSLQHSVCDHLAGFILAPMEQGIRLTTGVEFAFDSYPANRIQLERVEAIARTICHLGKVVDKEPWLGRRPALPDMRPVIGEVPYHKGLWCNFGHAHHGLTLGPVTGRLLAELMTGKKPFINPAPYSIKRFL